MKKSDLKTGMWVECKCGFKGCIMLDTPYGDIIACSNSYIKFEHNNDLTDKDDTFGEAYDIVRVFKSRNILSCFTGENLKPIWQREETIEMTIEEACNKLREVTGKPVKITI